MAGNLIIMHGGGPTAVINASLHGAIRQAQSSPEVDRVLVAIGGTGGFLREQIKDVTDYSDDQLRGLLSSPASAIGTSRDALEKPESPSGTATLPDNHKAEDVPTSERKTEDEPHPTYPEKPTSKPAESQPAAGSTNSSGQVYVPGFGYVDSSGDNTVIDGQDIYENGNKIGEMGGGN